MYRFVHFSFIFLIHVCILICTRRALNSGKLQHCDELLRAPGPLASGLGPLPHHACAWSAVSLAHIYNNRYIYIYNIIYIYRYLYMYMIVYSIYNMSMIYNNNNMHQFGAYVNTENRHIYIYINIYIYIYTLCTHARTPPPPPPLILRCFWFWGFPGK